MPGIGRSLGELYVRLGLDSRDLEQGAEKAERKLRGLRTEMRQMVVAAGRVAVSLGATAAALVAAMVKHAGEAAREVKNLSQVANASTREFQRHAAAAREVGIEADKLADVYKDMSERVGEFLATGGGPMLDFFEQIAPKVGVTAEQFRNLSGPQALQLYVDTLERANLGQEQMTFYLESIASDSTRLLPLLKDNGRLMRELGDDAERLGQILSDVQLDSLAAAEHELRRLGRTMSRTGIIATTELAPAVSAIAAELNEILGEAFRGSEDDALSWGETLGRAFAFTADAAVGAVATISTAFEAVGTRIGTRLAQLQALAGGNLDEIRRLQLEMFQRERDITQDFLDTDVTRFRDRWEEVSKAHEERRRAAEAANAAESRAAVNVGAVQPGSVSPRGQEPDPVIARLVDEFDVRDALREQAEAVREEGETALEELRRFTASAEELERQSHERRLEQLELIREQRLGTEEEWNLLEQELHAHHHAELTRIEEEAARRSEELARRKRETMRGTVEFATQALVDLTAISARESKKSFEDHKKASTANAIVSTYAGIARTLEDYSPPLSFAMAAAQAAFGFQQVAAIRSQTFTGGGSGAGAASGASSGTGGGTGGAPARTLFIQGDFAADELFSGTAVRSLLERIQEAQDDGARIILQ